MKGLIALLLIFSFQFASAEEGNPTVETDIKGTVTGYNVRNRDDKVNFGLVMPVLTKSDILNFKVSSVISPKIDTISALGQEISIPSNVSIPRQRERYSFFTITLDKPFYTLPVPTDTKPEQVGVLEGIFPFEKVVDAFRAGKPLFSLVNDFKFSTYSLAPVADPAEEINMEVGASEIQESTDFILNTEVPDDYVALGMTLDQIVLDGEEASQSYFPTDIKTLKTEKEVSLKSTEESTPLVVMIPEEAFESLENSTKKALPFSLVWNSSEVNEMMPLLTDLVTVDQDKVSILNFEDLNNNHEILGYKLTILRGFASENEETSFDQVLEVEGFGNLPESININGHFQGLSRVRLDVYASNTDVEKLPSSIEEMTKMTSMISRFEADYEADSN